LPTLPPSPCFFMPRPVNWINAIFKRSKVIDSDAKSVGGSFSRSDYMAMSWDANQVTYSCSAMKHDR
jgi:hypothetical protein